MDVGGLHLQTFQRSG